MALLYGRPGKHRAKASESTAARVSRPESGSAVRHAPAASETRILRCAGCVSVWLQARRRLKEAWNVEWQKKCAGCGDQRRVRQKPPLALAWYRWYRTGGTLARPYRFPAFSSSPPCQFCSTLPAFVTSAMERTSATHSAQNATTVNQNPVCSRASTADPSRPLPTKLPSPRGTGLNRSTALERFNPYKRYGAIHSLYCTGTVPVLCRSTAVR